MHLVINATEVGRRRGGNEAYIRGLLKGLTELPKRPPITLITCTWDTSPAILENYRQLNLGSYRQLPFFLWEQTRALRTLDADWYLSNYFLPPVLPCQGIVVVHDMSFRAHPEYYPRFIVWYMNWLTSRAVRQARWVVTVSKFSRREILRFYNVDQAKVVAIPNGVGSEFHPVADRDGQLSDRNVLARYGVTSPYILAVGNIHPRKNLSRLLDAYLLLKEQRPVVPPMVWVGIERWASVDLLHRAKVAGIHLTGFVAEKDLPVFYRQAHMLVYPSLYEGFGLPPLEAMACGTPVIVSDTTSLPEVVGDAGLRINPEVPCEMARAMAELLDDKYLRDELRERAVERVQQFSWRRTASELLSLL